MVRDNVLSILVDKEMLKRIDKVKGREARSSFLYRLIDEGLKAGLPKE